MDNGRPKRGDNFTLSFLKDVCIVTAIRKGIVYFRSGDDRYQTPLIVIEKEILAGKRG